METVKQKVITSKGKASGTIELDARVFGARVFPALVHQVVRWQLARRRAGSHSVLNRKTMTGGGAKPWKQKGTGRARAGTRNSPIWVGGAVAHGPSPRSYDFRLPKRTRRQALTSVLSERQRQERLIIVDALSVENGKTRELLEALKLIGAENGSALIALPELTPEVARAAKNLQKVKTLPIEGVNVYDILKHTHLVTTKEGAVALQERVLREDKQAEEKEAA